VKTSDYRVQRMKDLVEARRTDSYYIASLPFWAITRRREARRRIQAAQHECRMLIWEGTFDVG
jgi:hypothetical protein